MHVWWRCATVDLWSVLCCIAAWWSIAWTARPNSNGVTVVLAIRSCIHGSVLLVKGMLVVPRTILWWWRRARAEVVMFGNGGCGHCMWVTLRLSHDRHTMRVICRWYHCRCSRTALETILLAASEVPGTARVTVVAAVRAPSANPEGNCGDEEYRCTAQCNSYYGTG